VPERDIISFTTHPDRPNIAPTKLSGTPRVIVMEAPSAENTAGPTSEKKKKQHEKAE
jgi:hypothetical protein